jgi:Asp-tRNA(Asn)/Glu-tRNA(Gln) amidotransferase A subunit family amidase
MVGQKIAEQRVACRDAECALDRAFDVRHLECLVDAREYRVRMAEETSAHVGQFDALGGTVQQPCPQRLLEFPNRDGDGRLADVQFHRGARQLPEFGSRNEVPELTKRNVRRALEDMRRAGAQTVEVFVPDLLERILETSLYLTHSRADINAFLAGREMMPYRSLEAIRRDGKFHPVLDLLQAVFEGPEHPEDDSNYFRKLAARDRFQRLVVKVMADANVQALCYPTVQVLPPKKDDVRAGKTNTLTFPTNTLIASQTWMPSICVPAGFAQSGLPVGMELVVLPYHEPDLFRFGFAFEQASRARRAPDLEAS